MVRGLYLIDPSVVNDIITSLVGGRSWQQQDSIVGGWLVYDLLCKIPTRCERYGLFECNRAAPGLVAVLAWALCTDLQWPRGIYPLSVPCLGTIMVANVFFVIIPGQKKMVDGC